MEFCMATTWNWVVQDMTLDEEERASAQHHDVTYSSTRRGGCFGPKP